MIHKLPKISIGMPVYNGAKYMRVALDSLLKQTFADFELIISDNASTDETREICEEYATLDNRIKYFRHNKNQGAARNFRYVLDCAESEAFMWAACDDLWSHDYLANSFSYLSNSDAAFVFPSFEIRSIALHIRRRFDPNIFRFVESPDRKLRVLSFMALHYASHSANIVYSLFRTHFIRQAITIQDISNDGALAAVILGLGRGTIADSLFSKRYPKLWPGMLPPSITHGLHKIRGASGASYLAIRSAAEIAMHHFPEYKREIEFIYSNYHPYTYGKNFSVCSVAELISLEPSR